MRGRRAYLFDCAVADLFIYGFHASMAVAADEFMIGARKALGDRVADVVVVREGVDLQSVVVESLASPSILSVLLAAQSRPGDAVWDGLDVTLTQRMGG